jgi:hypothetical protein
MRFCQYVLNIVLLAYAMVVEVKFDAGVGLGVSVDFWFYMITVSHLDSETVWT